MSQELKDPFMQRLWAMRQTLVSYAMTRGFTRAEVQFDYPSFSDTNPSLYIQLWVGKTSTADWTGFPKCSPEEPDVIAFLQQEGHTWISTRPDPLENRAQAVIARVKGIAEEAAAAGLTYESLVDEFASHYPDDAQFIDEGPAFGASIEPTAFGIEQTMEEALASDQAKLDRLMPPPAEAPNGPSYPQNGTKDDDLPQF